MMQCALKRYNPAQRTAPMRAQCGDHRYRSYPARYRHIFKFRFIGLFQIFKSTCHPERSRGIFAPKHCLAALKIRRFFDFANAPLRMTYLEVRCKLTAKSEFEMQLRYRAVSRRSNDFLSACARICCRPCRQIGIYRTVGSVILIPDKLFPRHPGC